MREVYLDDLPKWENGGSKGKTNWKNSIGYKIKGIYDDLEFEIEIIDYNIKTHCIWVKYLSNPVYKTRVSNLIYCQLGNLLGFYTNEFKYAIGFNFKDNKRDITVIDRYYKPKSNIKKWYKYKCNKCDCIENEMNESNITAGNGCPICANKSIIKGINDIATTHQHLTKYFLNIEDAYIHSYGSDKKVLMKCPDCGCKKKMVISDLNVNGFSCSNCGDGISIPEKMMISILNQLHIDFIPQLNKTTFKWCKNYKYDFYIPSINSIIEVHGRQHYEKSFSTCGGRTLIEEQENDKLKYDLALNNNIKKDNYIVIDCRKSELEFIKNSVLNSSLSKLFDLSLIDWVKVEEFACKGFIKIACNLWNGGMRSTKEIGINMKIVYQTVIRYLKKGSELNWCDYDPKEELRLGRIKNSGNPKQIICVTTNKIFKSISDAEFFYNVCNISLCCSKKRKFAGKLKTGEKMVWMYYDEYLKLQEIS